MQPSLSILSKPNLSGRAFWDTDLAKLDFERYADFTIVRAFERGTTSDIREIMRYYGREKVQSTLTNAERLLPRAFVISRRLLHLHNSDFKCFIGKPQAINYSMY